MRNYYPLTAAQKKNASQLDSGLWYTAGIWGVSVVASVQAELDFGLLKNVFRWKQSVPVVPESVLQSRIKKEM